MRNGKSVGCLEDIEGVVYFISDCHFGLPDWSESEARERKILKLLDEIKIKATHLFLLGDIFDYWFEYKDVIPKHCTRFLGRLAELNDCGVKIYYILGNHDMWNFGYLQEEIGLEIFRGIFDVNINGKKVRLGHGDALDPKDYSYRLIKWIYARRFNQRLFASLHPRISFAIARAVSLKSRGAHLKRDEVFLGEDEPIIKYCRKSLKTENFDYIIFGHRHLPCDYELTENCRYLNSGDWLFHDSYIKMEDGNADLIKRDLH